jgi:hypothetical protein
VYEFMNENPFAIPPLELHQQPVVVEEARAAHGADVAQGRRDAMKGRLTSALRDAEVGQRLVRVLLDQHLPRARAHVGHLDEGSSGRAAAGLLRLKFVE